jgi:hypothetical protein
MEKITDTQNDQRCAVFRVLRDILVKKKRKTKTVYEGEDFINDR